jgi:hypothetical protein
VLRPYLCADPQQITQESYHTIERLATQQLAADATDTCIAVTPTTEPAKTTLFARGA